MTSSAHANYPAQHAGVIRLQAAFGYLSAIPTGLQRQSQATAAVIRPLLVQLNHLAAALLKRVQVRRQARADAMLWQYAQHDRRVMADLRCALDRAEG